MKATAIPVSETSTPPTVTASVRASTFWVNRSTNICTKSDSTNAPNTSARTTENRMRPSRAVGRMVIETGTGMIISCADALTRRVPFPAFPVSEATVPAPAEPAAMASSLVKEICADASTPRTWVSPLLS
ncbi:hypothetical protein GII32_09545 [Gordonia amarae]|uniref:hypothetical protein n=1 Tax=Gordonia amarae TaxID=36821 RepID=UPI001AFADED4|nr:hypothetical protein [Gordonia amarae]QHN30594.1 hypothetical protein GII32_09545 [Gordonia amarae]